MNSSDYQEGFSSTSSPVISLLESAIHQIHQGYLHCVRCISLHDKSDISIVAQAIKESSLVAFFLSYPLSPPLSLFLNQ
jgi:hypothetical protein